MTSLLLLAATSSLTVASDQLLDNESPHLKFGVHVGRLFAGEAYIEEPNYWLDTGSGVSLQLEIDYVSGGAVSIGGTFRTMSTDVETLAEPAPARITTIGPTLKFNFRPEAFDVRLGIVVGYNVLTSNGFDSVNGLALDPFMEIAGNGEFEWVARYSLLNQPTGGNELMSVTYGSISMVSIGAYFSP